MGWDYARFSWYGDGGAVSFTGQEAWANIPKNQFMNVLTDLGAMGWELVSVSWEVDVHGRATPFGGSTNTYSTQYMLFKRPWKDDAQASHVQQRAQWLVRNVSGLMMERACELAEYPLEEGIPTWMLPEIAPTFLTREEREKEKRMNSTERMQKMREERLRGRQL